MATGMTLWTLILCLFVTHRKVNAYDFYASFVATPSVLFKQASCKKSLFHTSKDRFQGSLSDGVLECGKLVFVCIFINARFPGVLKFVMRYRAVDPDSNERLCV